MSALAAGDVTYTLQGKRSIQEDGERVARLLITFGDGALTYPANGVPLSNLSRNGFPNSVKRVLVFDPGSANGYVYKYDVAHNSLRIYRSAGFTPAGTVAAPTFTGDALSAHGHVLHFQTSAAANAVTAAANSLRTAATAFDVAAVANNTGEGGVVSITGGTPSGTNSAPAFTGSAVAAGVLVELTGGVAPAAASLYLEVVGH